MSNITVCFKELEKLNVGKLLEKSKSGGYRYVMYYELRSFLDYIETGKKYPILNYNEHTEHLQKYFNNENKIKKVNENEVDNEVNNEKVDINIKENKNFKGITKITFEFSNKKDVIEFLNQIHI